MRALTEHYKAQSSKNKLNGNLFLRFVFSPSHSEAVHLNVRDSSRDVEFSMSLAALLTSQLVLLLI